MPVARGQPAATLRAACNAYKFSSSHSSRRDLGYIEGKNIVIEFRWAETVEQLQEAAAELVRMNVDYFCDLFCRNRTRQAGNQHDPNRLPVVSVSCGGNPVMLPLGRGKLATCPSPTGSACVANEVIE